MALHNEIADLFKALRALAAKGIDSAGSNDLAPSCWVPSLARHFTPDE